MSKPVRDEVDTEAADTEAADTEAADTETLHFGINQKTVLDKDTVYIPEDNELDSRCRRSTNLLSFYLTELNGLNVLIRLVLLWICFTKRKKIKNKYILFILIIVALHVLVHIVIIIASLPPLCDSSNYNWIPGKYFNYVRCHFKYEVYYSDIFWFLDSVLPNILLVMIMYYTKGLK